MQNVQRAGNRPYATVFTALAFAICFLLLQTILAAHVHAATGRVSFSWRANPVDDHVIGYRLYFGKESRLSSPYSSYIDFADEQRCVADRGEWKCAPLTTRDMQCSNLYGDTPQCTVFNMPDKTFVALTAYNAQSMSGFTGELFIPAKFNRKSSILPLITPLLLSGAR